MNIQNILKDPRTNYKHLLIVFVSAVLVGGGILGWQYWLPSEELVVPQITPTSSPNVQEQSYELQYRYPYKENARIIRINTKTDKKEVLIEDVGSHLSKLFADRPVVLTVVLNKLAFPAGASKIYFLVIRGGTPAGFVSLDVNKKIFKKLAIGEYFNCFLGMYETDCVSRYGEGKPGLAPGTKWIEGEPFAVGSYFTEEIKPVGVFLSPDEKKIALILFDDKSEDKSGLHQILALLDLEKDEAKPLAILSGSETLNAGTPKLWVNHFDVKWMDRETIEYSVFDQSTPPKTQCGEDTTIPICHIIQTKSLIEKRTASVK